MSTETGIRLADYIALLQELERVEGGDLIVSSIRDETCVIRPVDPPRAGHICLDWYPDNLDPEEKNHPWNNMGGILDWHEGVDPPHAKGERVILV